MKGARWELKGASINSTKPRQRGLVELIEEPK